MNSKKFCVPLRRSLVYDGYFLKIKMKKRRCPFCGKDILDLLRHVRLVHVNVEKKFPCSKCPLFFKTKNALVRHISVCHAKSPTHARGLVRLAPHNCFKSDPPKRLWICEDRADKGDKECSAKGKAEDEAAAPVLSGLEEPREEEHVSKHQDTGDGEFSRASAQIESSIGSRSSVSEVCATKAPMPAQTADFRLDGPCSKIEV
jgi:hypothetical protein